MSDKKILVADYNTRELQRLKKLFMDQGLEVVTVLDGKAALEEFEKERPDLVLLSAMLSKVNGFDVCKQIKDSDAGKNVPVILATSVYKGQKYRIKAIHENKASEFVEKPIPDEKLVEIVLRFSGDTRALIDTHKGEMLDQVYIAPPKIEAPAAVKVQPAAMEPEKPRAVIEAPIPPPAAKPEAAPTPRPEPELPRAAGPESAKTAAAAKSAQKMSDNIDMLLKDEITASLSASQAAEESSSDDSLDQLLSETLSGLGIKIDKEKETKQPASREPAPRQTPVTTPAEDAFEKLAASVKREPAPAPIKTDTAEIQIGKLEADIVRQAKSADTGELAVERLLRSFDTDLEKKLSDTLSGVGLSDTSIEKVIEPPRKHVDEPPIEEEGIKFGDYILLEKIGHGGMAELYKAKKRGEEGFQKIMAIKKILPHLSDNQELVTMFIDEAKIAAQLSHQNIANIFDFGKINNIFYIAMEYVDGFDLKKILSRAKELNVRVPHKLAAYIACQIASALDYAHHKRDMQNKDLNIVHRDVSPQNILISREGEVKLVDFGISKAESKIHHTVKGALKGKLLYMSPEQAWGKQVDKRSDLFSLGIVLCEMVSGKVLFEDSSEFDVLEKVRSGRIPLLENEMTLLPPRLKAVIDKILQIDITKRCQNAGELVKDLHEYLHAGGPVPSPKDLAAFMTRLFPDFFGLAESDVKHLTFDEFLEKEESLPAKALSEETLILESDEMAGLEELKPAEVPPMEKVLEEEEIIIESRVAPIEPPPVLPKEKLPDIRKEKKKEPLPEIRKEKKKEVLPELKKEKKPVPPPAPPKPIPAVKEKEKERERDKEKDQKTVLTKRSKEDRPVEAPVFAAATVKKSSSKTMIIAAVAGVVVLAILAVYFLGRKSGSPAPAPVPDASQTQPAVPGQEAGTPPETGSGTQPAPGDKQPAATSATQQPPKSQEKPVVVPPGKETAKQVPPTPGPQSKPIPETAPPAPYKPSVPVETKPAEPAARTETPVTAPPERAAEPKPAPVVAAPAPKQEEAPPKVEPKPESRPATPVASEDVRMDLPAADERVQEGSIVALTSDVKPPQLVNQVNPRIPQTASRMNLKGRLVCRVLISHTGAVEKVQVVSADTPRAKEVFQDSAIAALMQWKYKPAEKSGVRVKVWKTITLAF